MSSVLTESTISIDPIKESVSVDPIMVDSTEEISLEKIVYDEIKSSLGYDEGISNMSWQAVLVAAAVFIVPWTLFFTSLFQQALSHKKKDIEEKKETVVKRNFTPILSNSNAKNLNVKLSKTPELKSEKLPTIDDDDINAEPLHLHAMRIPDARLLGSQRNLSFSSRNSSRSSSRSRSRSSSPATSKTKSLPLGQDIPDNLSDISDKDADILTDNLGLQDIEPINHDTHSSRNRSLPPVNERMSEEALDDCHAFSDLSANGSSHGKSKRHSLPPLNERISKEKLDDCDAFKQMSAPERRPSLGRVNSFISAINESDMSCNNSILETFEEAEEEDELDDDEDEEMKKQQISHDVLFELLGTVSSPKEKKELKIAEERSRKLSFSSTFSFDKK